MLTFSGSCYGPAFGIRGWVCSRIDRPRLHTGFCGLPDAADGSLEPMAPE